jgi:hypothetical protein
MSQAVAIGDVSHHAGARGIADWLCLAAAPTFATMALLTAVFGGGAPDVLCSAQGASPLGGMVPMYLLMSAFHSAPWLKLISRRRNRAVRETGAFSAAGSSCPSRTCP